jgi:site-specific DNA recombinase
MSNYNSKIAIYARKSTESEDRQILSIDSQIKELRDYAENQKLELARVFTESMSAKSPGRPIFNELMTLVENGKFDQILCWKLDRLARNPVDGGALIWAMEKGRLKNLHTPQRMFVNTGNDKFWMQLEFGMAKKYVDDLSDNVKRGQRAKLAQGWKPGRPPPGYLNDTKTLTIVLDPDRFCLVRRMWDMLISGKYTPNKICSIANDEWKFRSYQYRRLGGRPFSLSNVYKMFRNPFYYGYFLFNGELYKGRQQPMVSKAEFDRAQKLLQSSQNARPQKCTFAYTGLIRCGECGASVTAEHKVNRYRKHYIYYHCTKHRPHVRCHQHSIEEKKLEYQIEAFLETLGIPAEFCDFAVRVLDILRVEETRADQASIESLRRRDESCQRELSELLNMKLRGMLSDAEFTEKKRELNEELIRTKELLDDNSGKTEIVHRRSIEAFEFAQAARYHFKNGTLERKRAILRYVCSNLLLRDEILLIEPQKPFRLIQKALDNPFSKKEMFEPEMRSLRSPKNDSVVPSISTWRGLVQDVRTFYWENRMNLESLKLPDVLKSIRK